MGKIKKTGPSHTNATVSPALQRFVDGCSNLPLHQLPHHLNTFPRHAQFPRGDLFNWISALNRFDDVLENFTKAYNLVDGPQTQPFGRQLLLGKTSAGQGVENSVLDASGLSEDGDRFLVEQILDFSRFLFENCANRRLYASSQHLDAILNTTSLSLLNAALRLALRLAQKYSYDRIRQSASSREPSFLTHISQSILSTHYQINLDKLHKLALPFRKGLVSQSKRASDIKETDQGLHVTPTYAPDLLSVVQNEQSKEQWIQEYGQPYFSLFIEDDDTPSNPSEQPPGPAASRSTPHFTSLSDSNQTSSGSPAVDRNDPERTKKAGHFELIEVPAERALSEPLDQVVKEYMPKFPKQCQYEFLCRLRNSKALCGSTHDRLKIIETRLLAVANYLNIFPEVQHHHKIFQMEGGDDIRALKLSTQLCDMLRAPPNKETQIPKSLQALALIVLEGYTNHSKKSAEVTGALGANVNHGVFTFIVRKAVNEMEEDGDDTADEDREWSKSLFFLLHSLPKTNPRAGEGFVAAGILESFVQALRLRSLKARLSLPQILTFLDVFIFNTRDAFNALVNAQGLDVLSDLLWYQVDQAYGTAKKGEGVPEEWKSSVVDYQIAYIQQATLRSLFKLIKNMMAVNSGTFDRLLRNLIESSQLLGGLRLVIEQPTIFGSNIWCGAVEILSNFIHNEPTSYAAIAEAGLTKAFLGTVLGSRLPQSPTDSKANQLIADSTVQDQQRPPPTLEAILMVPQGFGAVCLNENGMRQLIESDALSVFFADLLKPRYCKPLIDAIDDHHRQRRVEVESLGGQFDELARHHPNLKPVIIQNVLKIIGAIHEDALQQQKQVQILLGPAMANDQSDAAQVLEPLTSSTPNTDDVEMQDADVATKSDKNDTNNSLPGHLGRMKAVSEIVCGFFGNHSMCGPFADEGGIEKLVDILVAPVYPIESGVQGSQPAFTRTLHTFIQQKPHLILPLLIDRLKKSLSICAPFVNHEEPASWFAAYVTDNTENNSEKNKHMTCLSSMLTIRNIISVLTSSLIDQTQGRHHQNPMTMINIADLLVEAIPVLTKLQRSCILEFTLLHRRVPTHFFDLNASPDASSNSNQGATPQQVPLQQQMEPRNPPTDEAQSQASNQPKTTEPSVEKQNFVKLSYLLRGLPNDISWLLHSIGKSVLPRRFPSDAFQKNKILSIAVATAEALTDMLTLDLSFEMDPKLTDYYFRSILISVLQVMIDKRSESNVQFLTLVIWQFKRAGGFDALLKVAQRMTSSENLVTLENASNKPGDASWPVQGLRFLFNFFMRVTDSQKVSEAAQTSSLNTRADHFSPGQFLVEMRYYALTFIHPIWQSDTISKLPRDAVKQLCAILQHCLKASNESGAYKRLGDVPSPGPPATMVYHRRYEDSVPGLVDRGFPQDLATEAIYRCSESTQFAQDYCAAHTRNPRLPRFPIPASEIEVTPTREESNETSSSDQQVADTQAQSRPVATDTATQELVGNHLQPSDVISSSSHQSQEFPSLSQAHPDSELSGSNVDNEAQDDRSNEKSTEKITYVTSEGLEDIRTAIRNSLVDRCLYVLSFFDSLSFDLADLITSSVAKAQDQAALRADISGALLQSLISYQGSDDVHEVSNKVASSAHLLGVVFQDQNFFEAAREDLKDNIDALNQYLSPLSEGQSGKSMTWMSNVLLIYEKLLFEDLQPQPILWSMPDAENQAGDGPTVSLRSPLISNDSKHEIFATILALLPRIGKDGVLAMSCLRVLVSLTRDRNLARELAERKNLQKLFVMIKQLSSAKDANVMPPLLAILRQIIEDDSMIRDVMRKTIQALFDKSGQRNRNTISSYMRNMYHLSLRAPELFVEMTNELLTVPRVDTESRAQEHQLMLKQDLRPMDEIAPLDTTLKSNGTDDGAESAEPDKAPEVMETEPASNAVEDNKASELKAPVLKRPDGVTNFLLSELFAYKDVQEAQPTSMPEASKTQDSQGDVQMVNGGPSQTASNGSATESNGSTNDPKQQTFKLEDHTIFAYRCLLMQCLTELLQSYNLSKLNFIGYSRRGEPAIGAPIKPHSGVVNYLLQTLIAEAVPSEENDIKSKKAAATCNWALNVLTGLCMRVPEKATVNGNEPLQMDSDAELSFVRRFVLEHALKAYKDVSNSLDAPLDKKFSRLYAFADLFNRMLIGKPSGNPSNHDRHSNRDEVQRQIGKIMFEKQFIPSMTQSISELEPKEPHSSKALKCILRTIKLLTQVAIEMSSTGNLSTQGEQAEDDEIESASSTSEIAERREETPDLYRNSTLGMFEPGREHESSSEGSDEEDDDDDVYGDDYADDMEFDDENREHEDGEVQSDDDAPDGMGPMEGLSGDMPMEVEIELGEDNDDDTGTDEEDENDSSLSSGDESDDVEIMEEIEGDDNDSLAGGEDEEPEDWQDEDEEEDEIDFTGDIDAHGNVDDPARSGAESASENDIGIPVPEPVVDVMDDGEVSMDFEDPEDYDAENVQDEAEDHDSDDEDMEDEDDYDDELGFERHNFDEGEPDFPSLPWQFMPGAPRLRRPHEHHHHHHHHHHHRHAFTPLLSDMDHFFLPQLRSHRTNRPRTPDDNQGGNPLLNRNRRADQAPQHTSFSRSSRTGPLGSIPPSTILNTLSHSLRDDGFGFDRAMLDRVLQSALGQGGAFSISVAGTNSRGQPIHDVRHHVFEGNQIRHGAPSVNQEDPHSSIAFEPATTTTRWQEVARMVFGPDYQGKSSLLVNSILKVMIPPALEREKEIEARREERERKIKEQEARLKAEHEEREAREKKEREEKEAQEAAEREAAEAAEAEAARLASETQSEANQEQTPGEDHSDPEAMEGVESTEQAEESNEAGPSEQAERVVISIRGRDVDITHLGIDTAYLEALPEEMREEVIMQQAAEQRSTTAAAGGQPSTIDSEFLDALPADIREELLQQEASDRRRRERDEARRQAREQGAPPQAEEMDPASVLASLDPNIRREILSEQEEEILATLPPELAAEARALNSHRRRGAAPQGGLGLGRPGDPSSHGGLDWFGREGGGQMRNDDYKPQRRPIVQMLDKSGIAGLLRLMFMPMLHHLRSTLNGVLLNVCGNRQTRTEVINGLLSILQDGCTDVGAVEKCLSQLTLRAKQHGLQKTPQKKPQPLPSLADVSPQIVIDQCLHSLAFLAQAIPHIPNFFVTEHEPMGAAKSRANRKGKAKDTKASRYPFMALVALLERDVVINSNVILDQLSHLLAHVTHPLNSMNKKLDKARNEGKTESSARAESNTQGHTEAQADSQAQTSSQIPEGEGRPVVAEQPASVETTEAAQSTSPAEASQSVNPESAEQGTTESTNENKDGSKELKKSRSLTAPDLPPELFKPVVNMVMSRECNSKIFQNAIATMTSLAVIDGARDVFRQELIEQARTLAQNIQSRLASLATSLKKAENEVDAQSLALAELSPTGSDQTKFHRILTALDYLFQAERKQTASDAAKDELMSLYEEESFMSIWNRLDEVLSAIKRSDNSYFFNVATILLSLIESLMLVCKRISLNDGTLTRRQTDQTTEPRDMRAVFFSFTNQHRKILNDLVRHNPKLMSNNFSVLIKNPGILEFDNKRNYFMRRLHHRTGDARHFPHSSLQLSVRRDQVFLDSYKHLYYKSAEEIKYGKLNIRFQNEEGVDAGGVTREWFQVLARQMFNADYALFNPVASDRTTFHPNSLSWVNPEHLNFFKFIGRMIGKALYENRVLDCHFSRAVYKKILGQAVSVKDMETVDLEYTKNLQWMLSNDITDIITETFSMVQDRFGVEETIDLIPNGRNIPVTEENKEEYVRKVIEYRLTGSVQEQVDNFLKGFYDIVPAELISVFDEGELELLISGMPEIDIDDWRSNTDYHTYNASSPQIQWFWRAVRSFDKEERARLLQFVTGTGKVPLNGFKELEGMNGFTRFSIHKDYGSHDRLPSSHTCFNQLDLPEYDNYEQLRKGLYTAMTTGNEHFGFA